MGSCWSKTNEDKGKLLTRGSLGKKIQGFQIIEDLTRMSEDVQN